MHHRRGRDGAAGRGALWLWARKPAVARAALVLLACLLLLACWAASWTGELVYPTTIQQAAHWRPRTEAAAAALVDVPRSAQVVELVISRFSGNLSWVPGVVALLGVNKVVVYCKNPLAPPAALPCTHTLPNVGNEGHTYLWHITQHWDALPDLTVFLPDTVEYGDKLKTWRRIKRNLATHGRQIYYADDHTPITGFKFFLNFMNEIFYGYNFPCKDHRRGGTECVYFGHTDGVNPTGQLVPASPPDFLDWMTAHLGGTTRRQMARCGWGNRGMLAVSAAAVRAHPLAFYDNILQQLSHDVFPMAGMFMERLWRRVFLCSAMAPGGAGGSSAGDAGSGRAARRMRAAAAMGQNNPWLDNAGDLP